MERSKNKESSEMRPSEMDTSWPTKLNRDDLYQSMSARQNCSVQLKKFKMKNSSYTPLNAEGSTPKGYLKEIMTPFLTYIPVPLLKA